MLIDYIKAAMKKATYKMIEDGKAYIGVIEELPGVNAKASELGKCRNKLFKAAERWLLGMLWEKKTIPVLDGIDLNSKSEPAPEGV